MLDQNDKITLTIINARDINGKILPFKLELPIGEKYNLPENVVSLDIFEYHEGLVNGGNVIFSIYIGEITTINNLVNACVLPDVFFSGNIVIPSMESSICIQTNKGKQVVFAVISERDIVVNNQEKLVEVIDQLSNSFKEINNLIGKIRKLSMRK